MALKVFNLRCDSDHTFEGWFGSLNDFESQQERNQIGCPICGSVSVRKTPAAPYVATGAVAPVAAAAGAASPGAVVSGAGTPAAATSAAWPAAQGAQAQQAALPTPQQMQALFVKLAREIAANTEDVGARFAEEARRIHYKETEERGIRGVTTRDEAAALEEEGINVMPLPFGHLLKEPVQ